MDESYNKLFVKSCKEALEILQREKVHVHVIVTEMRMPEMTGLELLRIARKEYPNITGMVLTGYEQDTELQTAVEQGEIFRLIHKPLWKLEKNFETLIWRAIVHYNLQSKHRQSGGRKLKQYKAKLKPEGNLR